MIKKSLTSLFAYVLLSNAAFGQVSCYPPIVKNYQNSSMSAESLKFQYNQEAQGYMQKMSEIYNVDLSHCDQNPYKITVQNYTGKAGDTNASLGALLVSIHEVHEKSGPLYTEALAAHLGEPVITPSEYEKELKAKGERPRYNKGLSAWERDNLKLTEAAGSDKLKSKGTGTPVASTSPNTPNTPAAKPVDGTTVTGNEIEDKNLMATLTMTAVGFLTSRLYTCKKTPDVIIAAAGGAAFIAGEIYQFTKIKKELKGFSETYSLSNNEEKQKQIEVFEKLKAGYEKAISSSNAKIKLQQASAAAFAVAAATAGVQYVANKAAKTSCMTAIPASASACAAGVGTSGGVAPLKAAATNVTTVDAATEVAAPSSTISTKLATGASSLMGMLSSATAACPQAGAAKGSCTAFVTTVQKNMTVCSPASLVAENTNYPKETDYLAIVSNLIFPEAHAVMSLAALGISGAAGHFVLASQKGLAAKVDNFLANPRNRAIIWGSLAGLAFAASSATKGVIDQLKGNIALIDEIIKNLESSGIGQAAGGTLAQNGIGDPSTQKNSTSPQVVSSQTGSSQDIQLDQPLSCVGNTVGGKCATIESLVKNASGFESLDPATQQLLLGVSKKMEPVNGQSSISTASLDQLGGLGNGAQKAIGDLKKDLTNKYKIPAREVASMDKVNKQLLDAVKSEFKGQSPRGMYSSLGGSAPLQIGGVQALPLKDKEEVAKDLAPLEFDNGFTPDNSFSSNDSVDLGVSDSSLVAKGEEAIIGEDLDMSEMGDITAKEKNIFNVISERYQKTGYFRLFPKEL